MYHYLLLLFSWIIRVTTFIIPESSLGSRFRGFLYGIFMPQCGKNFQVSSNARIINLENFYVGDNVYLAPGVVVNAISRITLESEVMIGFNSVIVSGNHTLFNGSYRFGKSNCRPIYIKFGSWISANCTVTAGSKIGEGSLVAANSVVTGSLPAGGIYGGLPAKLLNK
jgi:acetyltransferase-like isoleucine patch superfamily enzyme